jgi:hypothetical protein
MKLKQSIQGVLDGYFANPLMTRGLLTPHTHTFNVIGLGEHIDQG